MSMKQSLVLFAVLVLIALLAGCAQLGLERPETQRQKIAYGYAQIDAAAQVAQRLVQEKKLEVASAKKVLQSLRIAKAGLDAAVEADLLNQSGAVNTNLTRVTLLLAEVQRILSEAQARPSAVTPKPQSFAPGVLT